MIAIFIWEKQLPKNLSRISTFRAKALRPVVAMPWLANEFISEVQNHARQTVLTYGWI
jgi:hypothetical protein